MGSSVADICKRIALAEFPDDPRRRELRQKEVLEQMLEMIARGKVKVFRQQ